MNGSSGACLHFTRSKLRFNSFLLFLDHRFLRRGIKHVSRRRIMYKTFSKSIIHVTLSIHVTMSKSCLKIFSFGRPIFRTFEYLGIFVVSFDHSIRHFSHLTQSQYLHCRHFQYHCKNTGTVRSWENTSQLNSPLFI